MDFSDPNYSHYDAMMSSNNGGPQNQTHHNTAAMDFDDLFMQDDAALNYDYTQNQLNASLMDHPNGTSSDYAATSAVHAPLCNNAVPNNNQASVSGTSAPPVLNELGDGGQMDFERESEQLRYDQNNEQTDQALIEGIIQALQQPFPLLGASVSLHCLSESDFKTKFEAYRSLCDHNVDPKATDDFPVDVAIQQQLVSELVAAMVYLGPDCVDRDSKTPVNRIKKLAPLEFDFMAWSVLLECRDIQNGKLSMPRWGSDWELEVFNSFRARFERIKLALHRRKSMVSSCFDYVFSKRMLINPTKEERSKQSNKDVNAKRADDLELAKNVRKGKQSQDQATQGHPSSSGSRAAALGVVDARKASKMKYRAQSERLNSSPDHHQRRALTDPPAQASTPAPTIGSTPSSSFTGAPSQVFTPATTTNSSISPMECVATGSEATANRFMSNAAMGDGAMGDGSSREGGIGSAGLGQCVESSAQMWDDNHQFGDALHLNTYISDDEGS